MLGFEVWVLKVGERIRWDARLAPGFWQVGLAFLFGSDQNQIPTL